MKRAKQTDSAGECKCSVDRDMHLQMQSICTYTLWISSATLRMDSDCSDSPLSVSLGGL